MEKKWIVFHTKLATLLMQGLIFFIFFEACSNHSSGSKATQAKSLQKIPFTLSYKPQKSLNLEESPGFNLTPSLATNILVDVSGCATGYTISSAPIASGF